MGLTNQRALFCVCLMGLAIGAEAVDSEVAPFFGFMGLWFCKNVKFEDGRYIMSHMSDTVSFLPQAGLSQTCIDDSVAKMFGL